MLTLERSKVLFLNAILPRLNGNITFCDYDFTASPQSCVALTLNAASSLFAVQVYNFDFLKNYPELNAKTPDNIPAPLLCAAFEKSFLPYLQKTGSAIDTQITVLDYIDEDGYFTFKNRLRRTVKISGETMCPSDVEDVIISIPEVYEAYCYGVKNERKGHVLRLAIVINKNCKLTEGEVIAKCYQAIGEKLNPSYMPDKVLIIDKLPRTAIGKVDPVAFKQITGGEELE